MSHMHIEPDHESSLRTPRWVKVFGIVVIALALLFVILHLTGNSLGGPGSHIPPTQRSVQQP